MIPSEEEKLRVSRNLLLTSQEITDWGDSNPYWYLMKCVYGDVEKHSDSELFQRISHLIAPSPIKTCINVGKQFTCSNCGANVYGAFYEHSYVDDEGKRWYTTANPPKWNYCPNCGCQVIARRT